MNIPWLARVVFLAAASLLAGQSPTQEVLREADRAYRAKEIPKAVRLFEQALETDPVLVPAHMMLGIIHAQQNQTDRAKEHFEAVVKAQPQNAAAHFFLARIAASEANWAKAASHFRAALENGHPDRDSAIVGLAAAEVHLGEPAAALTRLTALGLPAEPRNAAAYHAAAALAHRWLEDPRRAAESLEKAIEANLADPALREQLSEALVAAGEYSESLTEAIQAQRKFPDHAGIQYQLGIAGFYISGSPFTSLALRNLKDVAPEDTRNLVLEGLVQLQREEFGTAVELLRKADAAGAPRSRLFLAVALAENSEFDAAENVLVQAREVLDRARELERGDEEDEERLRRERPIHQNHPPADVEDQDDGAGEQELREGRAEQRVLLRPDEVPLISRVVPAEAYLLEPLGPEGAHDPDPGDVLLERTGHVAELP